MVGGEDSRDFLSNSLGEPIQAKTRSQRRVFSDSKVIGGALLSEGVNRARIDEARMTGGDRCSHGVESASTVSVSSQPSL